MKASDVTRVFATLWVHLLGVTAVVLATTLPFIDASIVQGYALAMEYPEFRTFSARDILLHIGLSAGIWALTYLTFTLIRKRARQRKLRTVKVSRGSAMTETLVILPAWMMLSMGIMQLSITSIAGVLTNLATFQAARAAWVWSGEVQGNRLGASYSLMLTKARVAAAMSLAPVAPGDYLHDPYFLLSDTLKSARAGMLAQQLPMLSSDQGAIAEPLVYILELEDLQGVIRYGDKKHLQLARSLDSTSFRLRSVRKLTWAYHATTVIPATVLGRSGAVVVYQHQIAMPLVPEIFGEQRNVMGRAGYYLPIIREFDFPAQLPANPSFPR
ncbi:MAG: hypothetical protein R3E66_14010 [bacterium]